MSQWLLNRLFEATDQPKPAFAIQGTINWMRALAEVINSDEFTDEKLKSLYSKVQRRSQNEKLDTLVFENVLMAYHNLVSLYSLDKEISHKYGICRSSIISWYYAAYFSGFS
jgi:hypothetical protein